MAAVGQQLTNPESGWVRYDDSDVMFKYEGDWVLSEPIAGTYKGKWSKTRYLSPGARLASFTVYFKGTDLRLIGARWSTCSEFIKIYIDDVYHGTISQLGNELVQVLSFEITNLDYGKHKVSFVNQTTSYLVVDAIDVKGEILNANVSPKFLIESGNKIYTIANSELNELGSTDGDKTAMFSQGFETLTKENCELIAQELDKAKIIKMDV